MKKINVGENSILNVENKNNAIIAFINIGKKTRNSKNRIARLFVCL